MSSDLFDLHEDADREDFDTYAPPWRSELNEEGTAWIVKPIPGQVVADFYDEFAARFAVRAVNVHDSLVEALRDCLHCLQNWVEIQDEEDARDFDREAIGNARALLEALGAR